MKTDDQPDQGRSKTPRTDAFTTTMRDKYFPHALGRTYQDAVDFARQLEQENAALRAALEKVDRVRRSMAETGKDFFIDGAQRAFPLLCDAAAALTLAKSVL